ncbi:MAG TPA: hypothetical protein VFG58_08725 [Solirubrobacterales bacterium]|nr:hypothetical protein [Solirubrobacterales bacterium]
MPQVEVRAGTIYYEDTGGAGPTLVLVPGLAMDHRQWERVVPELRDRFRNYPPGMGGWMAWLSAKLPGGLAITRQVLLRPRLARLPFLLRSTRPRAGGQHDDRSRGESLSGFRQVGDEGATRPSR